MEDNEYSLGVTEDSSSRVSYDEQDQGSDETGQGGDSSMLIEGGFSGGKKILNTRQVMKNMDVCGAVCSYQAFVI